MAALQHSAAAKLRPGMVADGWRVVRVVPANPWPWVLLTKGATITTKVAQGMTE